MRIAIGTAQGAFIANGAGARPAHGLESRNLRHLSRVGESLLAGADTGAFRSVDGGRTWSPSGLEGRFVWDAATDPRDPRTVYAVTQPSELHVSRDGGATWTEIRTVRELPEAATWCLPLTPPQAPRARTVVVDGKNPARLWVGIEVGGVIRTTDRGASWVVRTPYDNPDIHVMAAHPAKPDTLFVTTGLGRNDNRQPIQQRIGGVMRSDDAGESWQYVWRPSLPRYARPCCIDPRPPYAFTVGCGPTAFSSFRDPDGASAELFQTIDEGRTWQSLGDPAHSPSRANYHAVTPDPTVAGGVLVGTDTGEVWRVSPEAKWELLADGMPQVQALLPLAD